MSFDDLLEKGASFLKEADNITFISHADADGVCATAILQEACNQLDKKHDTFYLQQISTLALKKIKTGKTIVFVDMGSSHLEQIKELFSNVLILDHHKPEGTTDMLLVNPWLEGLDGTKDVSTAGIAFEIASKLVDVKAFGSTAIIGAQADNQELGEFQGYNKNILEGCVKNKLVTTREGARLHGINAKPLGILVAYSYDLAIPGVTRDRDGARRFLRELKLDSEQFFDELSEKEQQRLEEALIAASSHPDARITHYIIDKNEGPLRDTREAATLLNACCRMGKPELAVELLLEKVPIETCLEVQRTYKKAVHEAHKWYETTAPSKKNNMIIMNAENRIPPAIAGTLCSVLTRGREVPVGTVVVCLARNIDGTNTTKVSSRGRESDVDLSDLMRKTAESVGGEGGGHAVAAGAIIPSEKEETFIQELLSEF